jgi:hypothetical protein
VGNADDKFPPGQAPNGTDDNNGYECDGNKGIGKTNPAHTGCKLPLPPPRPPGPPVISEPPVKPVPPDKVLPKPPIRPVPPDSVLPKPPIRNAPPRVDARVVRAEPVAVLPQTGLGAFGFGVTGMGLWLVGVFMLLLSRRYERRRKGTA